MADVHDNIISVIEPDEFSYAENILLADMLSPTVAHGKLTFDKCNTMK